MNKIKILVEMQLKNIFNKTVKKKNTNNNCLLCNENKFIYNMTSDIKSSNINIYNVAINLIKFAVVLSIIYFSFYIVSYLRLVSLLPGIPIEVMTIIITFLMVISIITCSNKIKHYLFLASDNFVLLTFPIGKTSMYLSKLIVIFIQELYKNLYFILPLFLAYGLINRIVFYHYLYTIIIYVMYNMLIVSVSSLLSIMFYYLELKLLKIKYFKSILLIFGVVILIFLIVILILSIPSNIDLMGSWGTIYWSIQDFIFGFNKLFFPFKIFTIAFLGDRYGVINILFNALHIKFILITIGTIFVILCLNYFIVRPYYFWLASKGFENKKITRSKVKNNFYLPKFLSSIKKELLIGVRSSSIVSTLVISIAMPLLILLLNKIIIAMDTRLTGTYMAIAFNILLILLISMSSSIGLYSDIKNSKADKIIFKTVPIDYLYSLSIRIIINAIVLSLSIFISIFIVISFLKISLIYGVLLFFILLFVYFGHLLSSSDNDIFSKGNINSQIGKFFSSGKSTISAIIVSFIFAVIAFLLMSENFQTVWLKLLFISLIYFTYRLIIYISKIKNYYKDI